MQYHTINTAIFLQEKQLFSESRGLGNNNKSLNLKSIAHCLNPNASNKRKMFAHTTQAHGI